MGNSKLQNKIDLSVIEKSIDILTQSFQKYPDNYFSECELQYELYFIIKSSQEFNISFKTNDEKK